MQALSGTDMQVMSFFKSDVAALIAGSPDDCFWNSIVIEMSREEIAARHAVLAVASLYSGLDNSKDSVLIKSQEMYAMRHYNLAITLLRTVRNKDTILILCILFICIDFLRGDQKSAIDHCRHGIQILNWTADTELTRTYLRPAFYRLSIFPYFFGASPGTFPCLEGPPLPLPASFNCLAEAHNTLCHLMARAIRLIRSADTYRLGLVSDSELRLDITYEQQIIDSSLDSWSVAFDAYKAVDPQSSPRNNTVYMLEIRLLVCRIWLAACLSREETVYDNHMDKFRAIVEFSDGAAKILGASDQNYRNTFNFEMGFGPFLVFVVIKCRCLELRIRALDLMTQLSPHREHCWDMSVMYLLGQRTIEVEHDIRLGANFELDIMGMCDALPPEEKRIRDSVMHLVPDPSAAMAGNNVAIPSICFLMKNPGGDGVLNRDEPFIIP